MTAIARRWLDEKSVEESIAAARQELRSFPHRDWLIARTPGRDRLATLQLRERGFTVWQPTVIEPARKMPRHKCAAPRIAPMYPSYLFITTTAWRLPLIDDTVAWLMTRNERPVVVPREIIDTIMVEVEAGGGHVRLAEPLRRHYRKDDRVRVTVGPFAGYVGLFVSGAGERVKILLAILGESRETTLREDWLSPAEAL